MGDESKKVLNLKLNYTKPAPKEGEEAEEDRVTSLNLLTYMINKTYPELEGQLRRVHGRLQLKMENAGIEKQDSIELEAAEVDFLKKVVGAKTPPTWSKFVMVLEDELLKL